MLYIINRQNMTNLKFSDKKVKGQVQGHIRSQNHIFGNNFGCNEDINMKPMAFCSSKKDWLNDLAHGTFWHNYTSFLMFWSFQKCLIKGPFIDEQIGFGFMFLSSLQPKLLPKMWFDLYGDLDLNLWPCCLKMIDLSYCVKY